MQKCSFEVVLFSSAFAIFINSLTLVPDVRGEKIKKIYQQE